MLFCLVLFPLLFRVVIHKIVLRGPFLLFPFLFFLFLLFFYSSNHKLQTQKIIFPLLIKALECFLKITDRFFRPLKKVKIEYFSNYGAYGSGWVSSTPKNISLSSLTADLGSFVWLGNLYYSSMLSTFL